MDKNFQIVTMYLVEKSLMLLLSLLSLLPRSLLSLLSLLSSSRQKISASVRAPGQSFLSIREFQARHP